MGKKSLNRLNLWMNGQYIGFWSKKGGIEELQYDNDWVNRYQSRPLSLSLPFTPGNQKLRGDPVKFYFDNLLPDSTNIRERLAQKLSSKSTSPFDLLTELGRDCVGAIQLLPPDEEPINIKTIKYTPLTEKGIANILRNIITVNPFGPVDSQSDLRISLAGAQEKTALLRYKKQWCKPLGATPSTHIFKLPLGLVGNMKANMNESVENEWLCSNIVGAFQIPVAQCDIGLFEDQKALIVERFDRKFSSNKSWIIRLPQEDFCQIKGLSPLQKYQADGGLSITDCMSILDGTLNPTKDKMTFFKTQIIFWLLCATDGHCKNFSIRYLSRDVYELSPLYDILSMHPIVGNKVDQIAPQKIKMAMAIKGSKHYYHVQNIQRRHFINQAMIVGFSDAEAEELINEVTNSVESVIQQVAELIPDNFPTALADKIFKGMIKQSHKLTESNKR